jgi:hypothetical protein
MKVQGRTLRDANLKVYIPSGNGFIGAFKWLDHLQHRSRNGFIREFKWLDQEFGNEDRNYVDPHAKESFFFFKSTSSYVLNEGIVDIKSFHYE